MFFCFFSLKIRKTEEWQIPFFKDTSTTQNLDWIVYDFYWLFIGVITGGSWMPYPLHDIFKEFCDNNDTYDTYKNQKCIRKVEFTRENF